MAELAAWRASAPGGRKSELDKEHKQGEFRTEVRKATMFEAVSWGADAPNKFHMRVSLCCAQVKNAERSLGIAIPRSFHSRVWRNWQLGE